MRITLPAFVSRCHWRRPVCAACLATVLYLALAGLDAGIYHGLPHAPLFSDKQRELLYSYGVFDPTTNPLYRQWLHGYVNEPNQPPRSGTADDAYRAYGIALPDPPGLTVAATDPLGWWNGRMPREADVLFIGDSFCYGAGSGSARSIPALYEKATGQPVYAACKNGYGLPQYRDILRRLTVETPPGAPGHFGGRDVFVLLYVGNDTAADLFVYRDRLAEERLGVWRHVKLRTLWRLSRFLRDADQGAGQALAAGPTPTVDTHGYFPVPLTVPTQKGLPFAFHPFYRSFADTAWFGPAEEESVAAVLADLRRLAESRHLRLRVVLLPTALQVVFPRIDFAAVDRRSEFARKSWDEVRNLNALAGLLLGMLSDAGIETLDMEPAFMNDPDAGRLYWPTDSHLTPEGNAATVAAMCAAFVPDDDR
ncbi:hypothetical protein DFW101_0817 [Solidesulfovibrio carbinoliphilus subsp. oakridgensis]|uniref:AlgX/AlgJ SGNH hydrolase-like domain-containing protein n=1 Tax=Solidesulfovibrio carbinoliphilus subsp. oakridgensis TaxID=694327 RepID=G7Q443_9BACT|nr:hypothetical protein [Solidesulfovibrio carbinoliphilus]EHJ46833.1 hypothetical protein DFW101_0817 [Solidesulfovibrio carbinoliphilus subsp. oakridgensis]